VDKLAKARYLDLKTAYNLLRIKPGDEWKTAFRCSDGHFEPLVVQFGLANAPACFQRFMDYVFLDFLGVFVIVYLDDILVYSETLDAHIIHVKTVLQRIKDHSLVLKPPKCEFHKNSVTFLGYVVSADGIKMEPGKVSAIQNVPVPANIKEMRSFLGLVNYYRRFIPDFASITEPLTRLTRKNVPFAWNALCAAAFARIKNLVTDSVVLPHPVLSRPFYLAADASDFALGGVLSQQDSAGSLRPVAFYSRKFTAPELNYTVFDKELLAIVECLKHWRPYLVNSPHVIQIHSDHKNLVYFRTMRHLKPRHARWSEFLSEFNFLLTHLPGRINSVPDALSRSPAFQPEEGEKSTGKRELVLLDW
jgi:hypothetical protein